MVLATERGASTIPAILLKVLYFQPNFKCHVLRISMVNETRPKADPRQVFSFFGPKGDEWGHSSALLTNGVCSDCNDFYEEVNVKLEADQQIGFKFFGESGDVISWKVIYERIP